MQFGLKLARLFWVIAILMMAGGQVAHAYQDLSCVNIHASERHSSATNQPTDCPSGHVCCSAHSHILGAVADIPQSLFVAKTSSDFLDFRDTVAEGPVLEIVYPPQLS